MDFEGHFSSQDLQILYDERDVANLESLKDEFGIGTTAATTPRLLKAIRVAYMSERSMTFDVVPLSLQLGVIILDNFEFGK